MFNDVKFAPAEWSAYLAEHTEVTDEWPVYVRELLIPALAQAADEDGRLPNFDLAMFFENHVQVVTKEHLDARGDKFVPSDYNSFVGAVLEWHLFVLLNEKYLIDRHHDDGKIDIRLRLPA